jgi:copper chaperone CopZ
MNHNNWLHILSGLLLLAVCLYAVLKKFFNNDVVAEIDNKADVAFIVKGMTCNHCKQTVAEAINACDGIQDVTINLESGQTFIYGNNVNKQQIITSINNVGFSIGEIA